MSPRAPSSPASQRAWLAPNVLLLGLVSLLTDVASEMIIPLLPIFLTEVLGAGALALGGIEGAADAVASVLKLASGRISDKLGRRRGLVLAGYALSSLVRPLVALATLPWHVLAVRLGDRVGKGVRTSPRDALIADSVDESQRGAAFGLHRMMDHVGAVIGPLVAAAYLAHGATDTLRALFWWSALPGAVAVLLLVVGVREADPGAHAVPVAPPSDPSAPRERHLLRLLLPLALFTLGNASDVFLLLKAGAEDAPLTTLPLLWMALHVVKVVSAIPGGRLADKLGRTPVIVAGWVFYAGIYAAFAFATEAHTVWALFVAYGLYHGLTEGAERALVASIVPKARRGTGYGWYHLTLGVLTLAASLLFGALWEHAGSRTAFLVSAGLALLASVALVLLRPERIAHAPVRS